MASFKIGERAVGDGYATYFIADIAANHDGSLDRAKQLIRLAKESGADGAKFQHFRAPKIVSDRGFRALGAQFSHQAKWAKSVFETYEQASLPWEWTHELKTCCDDAGIDFLSTPYDFEAANMLDNYVPAYKIGSGDITWLELLEHVARKQKPVILSTGASALVDVRRAMNTLRSTNSRLAVMQCNTNYTGSAESLDHIHLNVLRIYREIFPDTVLGLSDHTAGHATALGAVALGASIIEKHFTDDATRVGPDHAFSMTPKSWREMVDYTRELERALGSCEKTVERNERETVVLQRRCLRAARDLQAGERVKRSDIDVLRPAPLEAMLPYEIGQVIGCRLLRKLRKGEQFTWKALEEVKVHHGGIELEGKEIEQGSHDISNAHDFVSKGHFA